MVDTLPSLKEIQDAAERIAGVASRTPLVESPALSRITGRQVFLKLECFQPIKSFKVRGAYNRVSQTAEENIVAASSGNHGIAVAYSCHLLGKNATVVVPEGAVKEKIRTIKDFGAKVVLVGSLSVEREAKARAIADDSGSAFIHPYNDPEVIAGQGTCGLEIVDQLDDFDSVLVPVGGGGLISGVSIAVKSRRSKAKVFGVEPAGAPKLSAALRAGRVVTVPSPSSIADGLLPPALGDLTFQACSRNVDGAFTTTEEEIFHSTKVIANQAGIIAEPSGATSLAPLLSPKRTPALGKRVVLVVSGGNISRELLSKVLA